MIRSIVIIEDEKLNVDRLKRLLRSIRPDVEILAELDSVADSVEWFRMNDEPDLVLMDVRLSDGVSFGIFNEVQFKCPIIFTTAYDEYAVDAFKYNSIDYLLKPVEETELKKAFEKCESLRLQPDSNALQGLIEYLKPKDHRTRFLLPFKDGYKSVLVKDVAFFYSENKITRAVLHSGVEEILPQTLEELEQQLNPRLFFRANRQFIIHIDDIKQVYNYFNSKLKVEIKNHPDVEIIVSRDKAQLLRTWMDF